MPFVNRKDNFAAYYGVPQGTPSGYLNGIHWENACDCGTYTLNGEVFILRCIFFHKDYEEKFGDPKGVHAESFDYSLSVAEGLLEGDPVVQALVLDAPEATLRSVVDASETLHPIAKGLIHSDLDEGLSGAQIAELRAALLDPKFLGFTIGQVREYLPKESYEYDSGAIMITEDGTEEPVMASTIFPSTIERWGR